MYRIVSLSVLLTLIVALGVTFFKVIAPFLLPLFLAGVVSILAQPLFRHFMQRTNGRIRVASGLTTGVIVAAILGPLCTAITISSMQLYSFTLDITASNRWDQLFGTVRNGADTRTDSVAQTVAEWINKVRGVSGSPQPEPSRSPHSDSDSDSDSDSATEVESLAPESPDTSGRPTVPHSEGDSPPVAPDPAATPGDGPASVASSEDLNEESASAATAAEVDPEPGSGAGERSAPIDEDTHRSDDHAELLALIEPAPPATPPASTSPSSDENSIAALWRSGRPITAFDLKRLARGEFGRLLMGLGDRSVSFLAGVFFSVVSGVVGLFVFTVAVYYFLADGTTLIASTERLIPVHVDYQRELLEQFARAVRSVVSATFLAAMGQAIAVTLALWFIGFDHLLTLFVLGFLSAMVPLLGTPIVWVPCAISLVLADRWGAAAFLVVYGVAVVGLLDNVIRTYVLNSDTKLHPLLALISVLGGVQVMGLWGVFIGPIVASCLHGLMVIFNHELLVLSQARFANAESSPAPSAATTDPTPGATSDSPPANTPAQPAAPSASTARTGGAASSDASPKRGKKQRRR